MTDGHVLVTIAIASALMISDVQEGGGLRPSDFVCFQEHRQAERWCVVDPGEVDAMFGQAAPAIEVLSVEH
jgi:hypothetical protein